ncbi:MAG TPA: methyltransferase domain-containing protein [Candidatus Acidoferrum sp.]|jgi:ubiquinone/menaquinone biosynthesis C-methylase UbiE
MQKDKDIISQWSESAPYWEKYREIIRGMFVPVTKALIESAGIGNGDAVLDIATGPGEPALSVADVVGLEGRVVGTDAVAEMVEAAGRESSRRNLRNASFEVALAEKLPYADNRFDAVVCRFGVMFFPSPVDAVREVLRVLKPGGRLALAVWHYGERNPFHSVIAEVVERYVETPPTAGPPDMFRFAAPGELLGIVASAGATAASERLLQFSIRAKSSVEDFWTLRSEMSDKLRTKLACLSPVQLAELKREVIEAIRAYSFGDEIRFPAEVLIVSGAKEASK